jgi:hypothetical protein
MLFKLLNKKVLVTMAGQNGEERILFLRRESIYPVENKWMP